MHKSRISDTAKWFGLEIFPAYPKISLSIVYTTLGVPPLLRLLRNPERVQLLSPRVHRLSGQLRAHLGQHVSLHAIGSHERGCGGKRRRGTIRMCEKCHPPPRPRTRRVFDMPTVLQVSYESMNERTAISSSIILLHLHLRLCDS